MSGYYDCNHFNKDDCFRLCNNSWDFDFKKKDGIEYRLFCKCFNGDVICDEKEIGTVGVLFIVLLIFLIGSLLLSCFAGAIEYLKKKKKGEVLINSSSPPPEYSLEDF